MQKPALYETKSIGVTSSCSLHDALEMQRRQALREKLNLDQFDSDPDAPDTSRQAPCKDAAKPSQVSIHNLGDYTSVVTVEPFGLNEDRWPSCLSCLHSLMQLLHAVHLVVLDCFILVCLMNL